MLVFILASFCVLFACVMLILTRRIHHPVHVDLINTQLFMRVLMMFETVAENNGKRGYEKWLLFQ